MKQTRCESFPRSRSNENRSAVDVLVNEHRKRRSNAEIGKLTHRVKHTFVAVVLITLFANPSLTGESVTGKVVKVLDGDTLEVLVVKKALRVRLAQIDTPEKQQPWGDKARDALASKVMHQDVSVLCRTTDRYGRCVGEVTLGKRDINREMVEEGLAWVYKQYATDPNLFAAQEAAQKKKLGLWNLPEPERQAPWEWRAQDRGTNSSHSSQKLSHTQAKPSEIGVKTAKTGNFTCGAKKYCREMGNCAEAKFYLTTCGLKTLDGDGDGVPCSSLCK